MLGYSLRGITPAVSCGLVTRDWDFGGLTCDSDGSIPAQSPQSTRVGAQYKGPDRFEKSFDTGEKR
ncbi:hypothetical protein E2C01_062253 [Portunus trituberculatus]|uniref:Uncharacterized protein n=1 Tax=Portunus trituberculatus TaxID=210409 RepID=A0A5B7HD48_PORTR|nr:hypothetical protein [Portunus trituberculatus]